MSLTLKFPKFAAADEADLTVPETLCLISTKNVEPIGYWYHISAALAHDLATDNYLGTKVDASATKKGAEVDREYASQSKPKKFMKLTEDDLATDWYDMLKLESGEDANENEIRSAYRKRCLETHPDKQPDHSDYLFKKVQRAFDILGDPSTRRSYDSSRPFDDTIPEDEAGISEEEFYARFGPVFDRNRKWSVDSKIPRLGDDSTPVKEVQRFYDAWYRFNSWRDFSHGDEMTEIGEDMCREEKRYYQRENQRIVDRHKKVEQKRVRNLVERAQKADPRLRKAREAEIAAREKEKNDRLAEKERIRTEEILRKAAIADKEKAEKAAIANAALAEKSRIKNAEAEMLAYLKEVNLIEDIDTNLIRPYAVRPPNIAWLYARVFKPEEAEDHVARVRFESTAANDDKDKSVPAVLAFNEILTTKEQEVGITRYGESIKRITADEILARRAAAKAKRDAAAQ